MTINHPDYLSKKRSMEQTFQVILALDPPPSLFKWKTVSNIPVGELDDTINSIRDNAYELHPAPSAAWISALITACTAFKVARAAYRAFHRSRQNKGLQKKRK
jgi:hypothetical protein